MRHAHHAAFGLWEFALTAVLVLAALVHAGSSIRNRKLSRGPVESWRIGSFLFGLFLIWLAMASPLAALDHELLTVHMIQHLLLMTIAPPLILFGAPIKRGWEQLSPRLARPTVSRRTSSLFERLGRTILQPTVCWLAATGTLVLWHIPPVFMVGMRSQLWHGFEQASFLTAGLLFWWPVTHSNSTPSDRSEWLIVLYLFLATLPCDILSGFLVFCDRVVYPAYLSSPGLAGFSALEDQQCAGALMWTCVTVVYLIAGTIFAARLLSPGNLLQRATSGSQPGAMPGTLRKLPSALVR